MCNCRDNANKTKDKNVIFAESLKLCMQNSCLKF